MGINTTLSHLQNLQKKWPSNYNFKILNLYQKLTFLPLRYTKSKTGIYLSSRKILLFLFHLISTTLITLEKENSTSNIKDEDEFELTSDLWATYTLLDENGNELESSEAGVYNRFWFQRLKAGSYRVKVLPPTGYELEIQVVGGANDITSAINPATGISGIVSISCCESVEIMIIGLKENNIK